MSDWKPTRALTRQSALGAAGLLAIALCFLVNYFGWKYYKRWDWTSSEIYSLSEKTENILDGLERDVDVTMFVDPQSEAYSQARELLTRYEAASPRVTVEVVDPARDLARTQELLQQGNVDVVIFASGDERRVVATGDLVEYDYSGLQFGEGPSIKGFKGEQEFTAAILSLSEERQRVAAFSAGHGEGDIDDPPGLGFSAAKSLLERDNFAVRRWESLAEPRVPEDVDLLVVAGPKTAFTEPEAAAIGDYLDRGGRVLALLDPAFSPLQGSAPTGLEAVLAANGAEIGADIVIDPSAAVPFFGAETLFATNFGPHAATEDLDQAGVSVILPLARSVAAAEVEGVTSTVLLETTRDGWGERDLDALDAVEKGDDDLAGPVPLAVAVEVESAETTLDGAIPDQVAVEPADLATEDAAQAPEESSDATEAMRLVVVGDSDFAGDSQIGNAGNAFLFSNLVNWLAEREAAVAIPPRQPTATKLNLSQSQMSGVRWLTVALVPLAALASGFAVYRRRRR